MRRRISRTYPCRGPSDWFTERPRISCRSDGARTPPFSGCTDCDSCLMIRSTWRSANSWVRPEAARRSGRPDRTTGRLRQRENQAQGVPARPSSEQHSGRNPSGRGEGATGSEGAFEMLARCHLRGWRRQPDGLRKTRRPTTWDGHVFPHAARGVGRHFSPSRCPANHERSIFRLNTLTTPAKGLGCDTQHR